MATRAEEAARKKHEEEKKRLRELGISTDRVLPDAGPRPPEVEEPMSNIDEIAASEAPYDDGYVEPELSEQDRDIIKAAEDADAFSTEEDMPEAKSNALAEGRKEFHAQTDREAEEFYKETGRLPEDRPFDKAFEEGSAEFAEEQQTFEEGQAAFKEGTKDIIAQDQIDHEERVKNNPYTNNPKDARHIEELEYREDRLRQLGSGMSRGDIAAANNPDLQAAMAAKAAREAAKPSIEEKAGIANKKITAMDDAMRKAGHEVDRGITPTFINPDTGKEEGGAHYVPSKHDVINAYDDAGNIVGQKVVDKKGLPEDPDKPSPEEMKRRRDAYANKIREDAVAQKAERKRQAMIRTGDRHGLKELDRQTAEAAATRLRDAEAAIRKDETLTANEQAIKIQELKNTGVTDVAQIGADAQTDVATTQAGASMYATDAGVEIKQKDVEANQALLDTKVKAEKKAAKAQAEVDAAATAVENAHTTSERKAAEKHLLKMQENLHTANYDLQQAQLDAAATEGGAQRTHEAGLQQAQIDADAASQTSAQDHATGSQTAEHRHEVHMQSEELSLARDAMNNQQDAQARQDAIDKNNREIADLEMAIASGTLAGDQLAEAEDRVNALRGIAPSTSLDPEHAEVSLERTSPEFFTELTDLTADYIEDSDGESWIGDNIWEWITSGFGYGGEYRPEDEDNLSFFAEHLQTMVDQKKITSVNVKTVSAIILGRMDGKVRERLDTMSPDSGPGASHAEQSDAWKVIMPILQGRLPTP